MNHEDSTLPQKRFENMKHSLSFRHKGEEEENELIAKVQHDGEQIIKRYQTIMEGK
jgi:hypothetical protein